MEPKITPTGATLGALVTDIDLAELDDPKISVIVGFQPDHPDRDIGVDETIEIFEAEGADRLMSTQADGVKNGAHYVLSRHFVESGESRGDVTIIDDCTNIHFPADLERATQRLTDRHQDFDTIDRIRGPCQRHRQRSWSLWHRHGHE